MVGRPALKKIGIENLFLADRDSATSFYCWAVAGGATAVT
jgi:hypothetical protein